MRAVLSYLLVNNKKGKGKLKELFNEKIKVFDRSCVCVQVDIRKLQGTIEFMSPEVMNCKKASTSADMWSVGVVTYMLLTGGKSPFYDGSR